jgi:ABC-type branched-subunit amino acid transport system ATPase component
MTVLPEWLNGQWRLALVAVPLACGGAYVRRVVDSSPAAAVSSTEAVKTAVVRTDAVTAQLPRRVLGVNGEPAPLLSVEKLNVGYGPVQVLFDVDLEVRAGQVVALLGTNGAGKTSLLRAISGLEPTLGGRVVYAGLDITSTRATWRVGMGLHQIVGGESVVGSLTVDENLRLFAFGLDDHGQDSTQDAYNTFPQLSDRRNQQAGTLSGGERQMLALSKVLMVRPQLLLIDEFSLGLAPVVIAKLLPVVREIASRGAAILLVEQSANIALSIADYAYVIEKGQIGYHGDTEGLRARPDLLRSAYLEGLSVALGG